MWAIPIGQLRTKGESALTPTKDTSTDFIRNTNMSCSAKLLNFNILGVQDALLSKLIIEPIYFSSIIKFNPKQMERALCGQIETDAIELPVCFDIIQPELMNVSVTEAKRTGLWCRNRWIHFR